jgi:hypothetical protein
MEIVTISVREINILASQSFHVAREAVNHPISRSSARLENEGRVPPTLAAHEQLQRIHTSITLGGTDVLATAIRHSAGVKRSNVTAERLRLFADSATHDVVAGDDFQHAHSAIYGGDVDAGWSGFTLSAAVKARTKNGLFHVARSSARTRGTKP